MKKTLRLKNEKGSVVVLALIILVLLTLVGMAVNRTTSIEVQIASNDSRATDCLYKAESADHYAIELTQTWMNNTFLMADETAAYAVTPDLDNNGSSDVNLDIDGDGTNDFTFEIRCIEATGTAISPAGTLSDAANDFPRMGHISSPPVGSGYSLKYFEVRRYGITGTAANGCSQVQVGAYKVFNKFN